MKIRLNKQEARSKGEAGLNLAVSTANKNHPNWADQAYRFFKRWLSRKPSGYRFQIENFRLHVQIYGGLPKPETDRAYGFIPSKAKREKLIKEVNAKPTQSTSAHGCYSMEWKKI